jgi:hypothetical protein
VANRYAVQQRDRSFARTWLDALVACGPTTSLVIGLGLGGTGWLLEQPGVAAAGAVVASVGVYVERLQARTLRRRRRTERMRSRHEVTELRRTIAQLRVEVGAFQRALLDTEAAMTARSLPLLPPVSPVAHLAPVGHLAPVADEEQLVVVPLADAEAEEWVQTPARDAAPEGPLPAQRPSPFIAVVSSSLPVLPVPPATPDTLVYAAFAQTEAIAATCGVAHPPDADKAEPVLADPVLAEHVRRSA